MPALRGFPLSPWLTKLLPNIWAWCQSLWRLSNFTSSPSSKHCSPEAPATRRARLNHPTVNERGVKVQVEGQTVCFSPKTATWTRAKSNIYTSTQAAVIWASRWKCWLYCNAALKRDMWGFLKLTINMIIFILNHSNRWCDTKSHNIWPLKFSIKN